MKKWSIRLLFNINYIGSYIKSKFCGRTICPFTMPLIYIRFIFPYKTIIMFLVSIHSLMGSYTLCDYLGLRWKIFDASLKCLQRHSQMPLEGTQVRPIPPKCVTDGILLFLLCFQHHPSSYTNQSPNQTFYSSAPFMMSLWWSRPCANGPYTTFIYTCLTQYILSKLIFK